MPRGRRRRRLVKTLAGSVAIIALVSGCGSGGGGGDTTPQTANVNLNYEFGSLGAPVCTGHLSWRVEPVRLTGSHGSGDPWFHAADYRVQADGSICRFRADALGLRTGRWRVMTGSLAWEAACEVELKPQFNSVTFRQGQGGCQPL